MLLPASFVLHLNTDLPLEVSKYEEIKRITGIPFIDTKQVKTAPLLQLITKSTSDESLDSSNNRGLFVVSNLYLRIRFKDQLVELEFTKTCYTPFDP